MNEAVKDDETLPSMPFAFYSIGKACMSNGDYDEALKWLTRTIKLPVIREESHYASGQSTLCPRAKALFDLGCIFKSVKKDRAQAVDFFRMCLKADPSWCAAHINLGAMLCENSVTSKEGISLLQRALKVAKAGEANWEGTATGSLALALTNIGIAKDRDGDDVEAATYYKKALNVDPQYVNAHNCMGGLLHKAGDLAASTRSYRRAVAALSAKRSRQEGSGTDSLIYSTYFGLALVLQDCQDDAGAIDAYATALATAGTDADSDAYTNLGILQHKTGDLASAVASHKRAVELASFDSDVHYNLGVALNAAGEIDSSSDAFRQAMLAKRGVSHAAAGWNLVVLLDSKGPTFVDEVVVVVREVLALDPRKHSTTAEHQANCRNKLSSVLAAQGCCAYCAKKLTSTMPPQLRAAMQVANVGAAICCSDECNEQWEKIFDGVAPSISDPRAQGIGESAFPGIAHKSNNARMPSGV
jgi:tetratricopeptide (TPR) repeat protein